MNIRFNRKLLAILISVIALLSIATAKDYSVTAGNWQVDFSTNDTLYTETEWEAPKDNSLGGYTITVEREPGSKSEWSVIQLKEVINPLPFGKDSLTEQVKYYISPYNKTPILSDYLIGGKDVIVAEGWDDKLGGIRYVTIYAIDLDQYGYAHRLVGFASKMDKKSAFEILDSLHVEYTGSMPTQTPAPATIKITPESGFLAALHPGQDELSIMVKQNAPGIDYISVIPWPDGTHIVATYELKRGSTASDNARVLAAILQMYASVLNQDPAYNGYLEINGRLEITQDAVGPNTSATYEATAYETRANIDPTTGLLSTDYINKVLSSGKSITYSSYMSDGYGDVTKAVDVPGGRAGPSQGSWL